MNEEDLDRFCGEGNVPPSAYNYCAVRRDMLQELIIFASPLPPHLKIYFKVFS